MDGLHLVGGAEAEGEVLKDQRYLTGNFSDDIVVKESVNASDILTCRVIISCAVL